MIDPRDEKYKNSILTIPNFICLGRLGGSFVLVAVAVAGQAHWFLLLFIVLSLSDWIDGRLARWLKQRSDFGARIDSLADSVLYASLLIGVLLLRWATVRTEVVWLAVAVGSYVLSSGVGLWRFGRFPSYHTFAAKKTQFLVLLASICVILDWSVWPLRIAAIAATLTNLEATMISMTIKKWRADVSSLFVVWQQEKKARRSSQYQIRL